jgi:phage FluMu protein Com
MEEGFHTGKTLLSAGTWNTIHKKCKRCKFLIYVCQVQYSGCYVKAVSYKILAGKSYLYLAISFFDLWNTY